MFGATLRYDGVGWVRPKAVTQHVVVHHVGLRASALTQPTAGRARVLQARSWLPRTEGSVRLGSRATASKLRRHAAPGRRRRACAFPKPADGRRPGGRAAQHGRRPDRRRPHRHRGVAGGRCRGDGQRRPPPRRSIAPATARPAASASSWRSRRAPASPGCRSRPSCSTGRGSTAAPTSRWRATRACWRWRSLIFGRAAMGEDVRRGSCRDAWRVRRDGKLVFADTLRVDGAIADALDRPRDARRRARRRHAALRGARRGSAPRAGARAAGRRAEHGGRQQLERPAGGARLCRGRPHAAATISHRSSKACSGRPLPRVWQC